MTRQPHTTPFELLTPAEVAAMFRVDAKTVTRWHNNGKLRAVRTPGGHRRFVREDVDKLLNAPIRHSTCPDCEGHR